MAEWTSDLPFQYAQIAPERILSCKHGIQGVPDRYDQFIGSFPRIHFLVGIALFLKRPL